MTYFTAEQIQAHTETVLQRLGDATQIELQREVDRRRTMVMEEQDPEERRVLNAEIAAIDSRAQELAAELNPPVTPEQIAQEQGEGSPLALTLKTREITERLNAARESGNEELAATIEQELREHEATPPAEIAREARLRYLRGQRDTLPQLQHDRLYEGDTAAAQQYADELAAVEQELHQLENPDDDNDESAAA